MQKIPAVDITTVRNKLAYVAGQFMQAFLARDCPRHIVLERGEELGKWLKLYLRYMRAMKDGRADVDKEVKPPLLVRPNGKPYV